MEGGLLVPLSDGGCMSDTNVGIVCMLVMEPRLVFDVASHSRVFELTPDLIEGA